MVVKEFLQLRRDRRTLAMMIVLPLMLLIIFGYAASFDVSRIPTVVVGPSAKAYAQRLEKPFALAGAYPAQGLAAARRDLRDGKADVAFVTGGGATRVLVNGADLFTARAAETAVARMAAAQVDLPRLQAQLRRLLPPGHGDLFHTPRPTKVDVLYNPGLKTALVMVPGLAGVILVFIGTLIASLGVVRERQAGTFEQLAVMPLSPWDVLIGKIAPYFLVAAVDLGLVLGVGMWLFDVPMHGSWALLILGALLFLFVTLSIGVLISSVSQNQGQAIQLAMLTVLPQILLSGLIFPLSSMAVGVRWIAYVLPLTYFVEISRGVMLQGQTVADLWRPFVYLAALGAVAVTFATLRFYRLLNPAAGRDRHRTSAAGKVRA
jgi:ABC-2 type transport system permease protein